MVSTVTQFLGTVSDSPNSCFIQGIRFEETKALLEQEENLLDKVDDVDSDLEQYVQRLGVILKQKIENFTILLHISIELTGLSSCLTRP